MEEVFNKNTIEAIKMLTNGMVVKEITKEFVADDKGDLVLTKKKVNEKMMPPNIDIIKMIYASTKDNANRYHEMTDEELEREKIRLLKKLKEEENCGN